ncbi:putative Protein kinase domain [Paratrimastix pyriformis]|uniref:Protein kinase domain-containing protein n=1 Tax=Paratrimastix pyriformis TaxID=342808 RepID=A0ABQ8UHY9_9EUKA|nr:putative Protein kinase domain [Paratrimastix pyriformis]|eukprot:GAFH01002576.1.p1 GENE.GAFH01002576.1~~GAFH01002576.1.p1  ORF type:complete len:328 (-),score=12.68 GAFH01002576.1:123-1106(-)
MSSEEFIGKGADASVWRCKGPTGIFAGKRYHADKHQKMDRESRFLHALSNHPNVVKVVEVLGTVAPNQLNLEFCPSTLEHILGSPLADDVLLSHTLTLVITFRDMHRKVIFHLDIKPENILIREDKSLVVADFSFAESRHQASQWHGNQATAAPEMWEAHYFGKSFDCEMADVFSLGATLIWLLNAAPLWPMACRCDPFLAYDPAFFSYIVQGDRPRQTPRNRLLFRLWPILRRMCDPDPSERPSLDDVLRDIEAAEAAEPLLTPTPAPAATQAAAAGVESAPVVVEAGSLGATRTLPPPPIDTTCVFEPRAPVDESLPEVNPVEQL